MLRKEGVVGKLKLNVAYVAILEGGILYPLSLLLEPQTDVRMSK